MEVDFLEISNAIPYPFNIIAAWINFAWNVCGQISFFGFISIRGLVLAIIIYEIVIDFLKKFFGVDRDGEE